MRLSVTLLLLALLATPAVAQEDCAAKVTAAIARQDKAALDSLISNQVDRSMVLNARASLQDASSLLDRETSRIEALDTLYFSGTADEDQKLQITVLMNSAEKIAATAKAEMLRQGELLEAIVKRACADEEELQAALEPVLELIEIYPTPTELDWRKTVVGNTWTTTVGGQKWIVTDGRAAQIGNDLSVVTTWTRPPKTIGADGLTLALTVDASSTGAHHQPSVIAQSRWFVLAPDPAQAGVTVAGNEAGNRVTVTLKAPVEIAYDGYNHEFGVGTAFGAGMTYVYSVPQPKLPPS